MKANKLFLFISLLIFICVLFTGCWNYKEIEQLAIVAGTALDKNADGTIHLTMEIVDVTANGQVAYKPVYIESDGKSFFEAVRKAITLEGKKLYWSHAKVVVLCEELAREDVTKYLDFLFRDAEAREDIWLLISTEKTAAEILRSKGQLKPIVSFQLDDTMRSQKSISRFPLVELYEFFDRLFYENVSPVLPTVKLVNQQGEKTPQVEGTAVFKDKKLIAFLDEQHTKCLLWLRDEVKGGLIVLKDVAGTNDNVTFEIYKSKSKITPIIQDDIFKVKVDIDMDVSIGEISGSTNFISGEGKEKLIEAAQNKIEEKIKETYTLVRDNYNTDIFGFGRRIDMKNPAVWNQIKHNWDEFFGELELEVNVKLKIRGSATTRTPLKIGE